MSNKFFDPNGCPFEVRGFFEEFNDAEAINFQSLGFRAVEEPTRPLGSDGRVLVELTEDLHLRKGLKDVVVKASKQRPRKVWAMLQVICGRVKK